MRVYRQRHCEEETKNIKSFFSHACIFHKKVLNDRTAT